MNGLNQIIANLETPTALKILVETLGFQHLDLEVTIPRVEIFRSAIVDLLQMELGARFTATAKEGWCMFLNYVGGAYVYVRQQYAGRLRILASSWATANNKAAELAEVDEHAAEGEEGEGGEKKEEVMTSQEVAKGPDMMNGPKMDEQKKDKEKKKKRGWGWSGGKKKGNSK